MKRTTIADFSEGFKKSEPDADVHFHMEKRH